MGQSDERIGTNESDPQRMKETSPANQEPSVHQHKLPIIARTIMRANFYFALIALFLSVGVLTGSSSAA